MCDHGRVFVSHNFRPAHEGTRPTGRAARPAASRTGVHPERALCDARRDRGLSADRVVRRREHGDEPRRAGSTGLERTAAGGALARADRSIRWPGSGWAAVSGWGCRTRGCRVGRRGPRRPAAGGAVRRRCPCSVAGRRAAPTARGWRGGGPGGVDLGQVGGQGGTRSPPAPAGRGERAAGQDRAAPGRAGIAAAVVEHRSG